jgi:hypothetical protein
MNRLRSCFLYRFLGSYVLCPLWLLGFRVAARARGLRRLRVGKLSVWGDAGFLALCRSSIERLESLDSTLHRVLTQGRWAWLFQAPGGLPYIGNLGPPWLFSVDPPYVAWQSEGIIARLIYVAFCMSEFLAGHASGEGFEARHKLVMKQVRSWLETRRFPEQLLDCYADPSGAQPDAPPNGGPAVRSGNSGAGEGPPSVS